MGTILRHADTTPIAHHLATSRLCPWGALAWRWSVAGRKAGSGGRDHLCLACPGIRSVRGRLACSPMRPRGSPTAGVAPGGGAVRGGVGGDQGVRVGAGGPAARGTTSPRVPGAGGRWAERRTGAWRESRPKTGGPYGSVPHPTLEGRISTSRTAGSPSAQVVATPMAAPPAAHVPDVRPSRSFRRRRAHAPLCRGPVRLVESSPPCPPSPSWTEPSRPTSPSPTARPPYGVCRLSYSSTAPATCAFRSRPGGSC